jgi:heavy metal sensor kinase
MKPSSPTSTIKSKKNALWRTLRFRFALWVIGLLLVVLAGFSLFVYFNLRISLLSGIDDALRLSASQAIATANIQNGQVSFADSLPDGSASSNLQDRGLTIRILDPNGVQLEGFGPFLNLPVSASSLAAASKGQATLSTISDPGEGDSVRLYSEPILDNGQLVGVVQVAQSLGNMNDTLSRLLTAILLGAPLLVGIAGIGGYFLAARALAPIDQMTLTAQHISAEDLSARIDLPGTDDEVGRLAATFDHMIRRLDEAFRRERQFTADASHELRTPLAAMQAIISVIREERRSPEDYELALDDLAEETDRLRTLTEDLLNLALSDTHKTTAFEDIDISMLLSDLCDSLRPLAEKKGLTLTCDISDNIIVSGDGDSLIRLFVNLLDNAIKYTSCGGITVSVHRSQDNTVALSITDTGQGIPAEDLPHIFERFYRVEKSRASRGSGLGLAIAAQIAHAHSGEITVKSTVGKGTTFTVQLPIQTIDFRWAAKSES